MQKGDYVRTTNGIVQMEKIINGIMIDTNSQAHYEDLIRHTDRSRKGLMQLLEVGDYYDNKKIVNIDKDYDEDTGWMIYAELENGDFISEIIVELNKIKTKEQNERR